jgi:hypothetical protein
LRIPWWQRTVSQPDHFDPSTLRKALKFLVVRIDDGSIFGSSDCNDLAVQLDLLPRRRGTFALVARVEGLSGQGSKFDRRADVERDDPLTSTSPTATS